MRLHRRSIPFPARTGLLLVLAGTALSLATCGGDDGGPTDPGGDGQIARIEVTPGADTLTALGDAVQLSARAFDDSGTEIAGTTFTWSSSDEAVVTVAETGTATAAGNGVAQVTAAAEGVSGAADLAVSQRVETVTLSPASATLTTVGATQQFSAAAIDANGNAVAGAPIVWSSENHAVATVDSAGVATARGTGQAAITATVQDVPGHAALTVNQDVDHLAFRTQPASATAGVALDPAVQVEVLDADGSVVEDAEVAITLAIADNPGVGALDGTKTVSAVGGVASFSGLTIESAGVGYTLEASSTGISPATSGTFDISAADPVRLGFVQPPEDRVAGEPLGVGVAVRDEFGNIVTWATDSVTIERISGPAGTPLVGTTTVAAVDGIATFDAVAIEKAGDGYALGASAPGLASDSSGTFAVTPGAPQRLGNYQPSPRSGYVEEALQTMAFVVRDTFGNVVDTSGTTVTLALGSGGFPGVSVDGDLTEDVVEGFAHFDSVTIDKPGTYSLIASSPGLPDTVQEVSGILFPAGYGVVTAGAAHSCMGTEAGPYCWGANDAGQLGGPTESPTGDSVAVAAETDLELDWVTAGTAHTCATAPDDTAYCWGSNASGQVGDGNQGNDQPTPVPVSGVVDFFTLSAGDQHTCGISTTGSVYCWGANGQGQLGTGSTGPVSDVPVEVTDTILFDQIVAGESHTCGLGQDSLAYCWGDNADGQLGDGNLGVDAASPVAVSGGHKFAWLDAGARHTCGIDITGDVRCWGANGSGQLGDGGTTDSDVPLNVTTVASAGTTGSYWGQIAAGAAHTCVIDGAGGFLDGIWCWGDNAAGQLGRGSTGGTGDPGPVLSADALEWIWIAAGGNHTCAFAFDDDGIVDPDAGGGLGEGLWCWGANGSGQLGDGTTTLSDEISRVVQGF